jgi:hypothetical protein
LISCGGGASVASGEGVGTGGTGISMGTVTGFGSVVIDGKSYNSASPSYYTQSSLSDAAPALPTDVNLGDQVQVDLDAQGNPSSVIIAPDLVGAVAAADTTGFSVNGVRVQFNNQLKAGPLTYFSGLQGPGSVQNGMQVAVSGAYGLNPSGAPWVMATLIERLPDANTILRTSGIVSGLDSSAQSFQIGSLTIHFNPATLVLPKPTALANGVFVKVWSNQSLSNGGATLSANIIRARSLLGRTGSVQLSGLVSLLSGSHFQISGIGIDASANNLTSDVATPTGGQYVTVRGQIDSSSGSVVANAIDSYASQPVQTAIQGTITGYTGVGAFFVRGVPVDASTAQITFGSGVSTLADGMYVELVGTVGASNSAVIVASTVTVIGAQAPNGKSVIYRGLVRQFVSASQPFVLVRRVNGVDVLESVTLASNVSYGNGSASQLANNVGIELEATKNASGLTGYSVNFIGSGPGPSGGGVQPVLVRGRVDALSATTLYVAGLAIQLNGVIAQGGALVGGARVEVWISATGGMLLAQSITIKN